MLIVCYSLFGVCLLFGCSRVGAVVGVVGLLFRCWFVGVLLVGCVVVGCWLFVGCLSVVCRSLVGCLLVVLRFCLFGVCLFCSCLLLFAVVCGCCALLCVIVSVVRCCLLIAAVCL